MSYKATFKRYESKYLLTLDQKQRILEAMNGRMEMDEYGRTTIRSIYFDTENDQLIRSSIEKPVYKEKLRIRSYQAASANDPIFVELKKKYKSVVYKRRLTLPMDAVAHSFNNNLPLPVKSQIGDEIEYFREFYKTLRAKVFISYEREAFFDPAGSDFRVTFDENILFRTEHLTLGGEAYGTPILSSNQCLMEIKTPGSIPLWMCQVLTDNNIYKTSFSKYGTAYRMITQGLEQYYEKGILKYA